jgi:peptidoglycan/xylan/chitin deacetylase (PgdA/CDA1 family)
MRQPMKLKLAIILLTLGLLANACNGMALAAPAPTSTVTVTATLLPSPTATATITSTPTFTPTFTASPVPTPTWVEQGPGHIQVPILMYHHITAVPIGKSCVLNPDNYCVSPDRFDAQLKLLHDWGYTTITTTLLVKALTDGVSLPPRPVIITFDDGNLDNYTNAFPIMQKYGFTGVLYIVSNRLQSDGYLNVAQIKEMAAAGWEVGSHSISHPSLTGNLDPAFIRHEIVDSKKQLEEALGVPVLTFAYPFGDSGSAIVDYVRFAGYIAAMDAWGFTADQWKSKLFDLQRCEIKGSDDVKAFTRFLPWLGDPIFLPTNTPTATLRPTRTPIPTYTQYPTKTPSP